MRTRRDTNHQFSAGRSPALEVRELTKIHGEGATAVHGLAGVDLRVDPGTFVAVMGPSGSGKSTLLSCIAGVDDPTGGSIAVNGQDVTGWSEDDRAAFRRDRLGLVFQDLQLVPYLNAAENVALPGLLAGHRPSRKTVQAALDQVGMGDVARRLPSSLSGGQRQRVAIARALVIEPALILADEPTGALDLRSAHVVLQVLRDAVDGPARRTVVMVTHDPRAAAFADRVVFLADGRIVTHMERPTAEAVAGQLAHLDNLIAASAPTGAVA